jgi:hypothetical protein
MMAAQPRVGEGLGPAGEWLVARDGDGRAFFALSQNLEQELGSTAVEFRVSQLIQAEQVDAAVAVDRPGQPLFVSGFGELVDQLGRQGVPGSRLRRRQCPGR